jgi:hypothetical protein
MAKDKPKDKDRVAVYLEPPQDVKEDFLDICYSLDMDQVQTFAQVVRFYKEEMGVKPRPSRVRK